MDKKVELLAPAGSYETFLAVINAGADAVYLAGNRFGARAYAGNLSDEELLQAIDYANLRGRKIYLTVNTLLKNKEIKEQLYDYLEPLYKAGLTGVIVQDYGVMKLICSCFPNLEIHASTQMTITDPGYFELLKKYGVTRIVPARELDLSEIKKLHDITGLEIESFVHGALCYCYSGMCFMSSFLGGRSGNRGRCAGTCRLEFSKNGIKKPLLSLKDLCTLNILPDLIEAGVYSMKIEGRMKSAEYASGVTSIYRKYVDLYLKKGRSGYKVDKKDIERLLLLFDRGGLTEGYYKQHNGKDMIANATKSDKSQDAKKAFEDYLHNTYVAGKNKIKINMQVELLIDKPAAMILTAGGISVRTEGEKVSKALNRAMTREDILKQITKLGETDFETDKPLVTMDEGIFIPNKCLNELRRNAILQLKECLLSSCRRNDACEFKQEYNNYTNEYKGISAHVMTVAQAGTVLKYNIKRLVIETEIMDADEITDIIKKAISKNIECLIACPRIDNKSYDEFFYNNLQNFASAGVNGVLIRNMSQISYIRDKFKELKIYTDYTCYGFNDLAANVIYDMGVNGMTYPIELKFEELKRLKIYNPEMPAYGRIPLMTTANCVDKTCTSCHKGKSAFTEIKDRKNAVLPVLTCCRYCYNIIYNSVPVYLIDKMSEIMNILPSYIGLDFTTENERETDRILKETFGECKAPESNSFTRGHFVKGVE